MAGVLGVATPARADALCGGAALPSGFAITNGIPHMLSTPYPDNTQYNPTSISIFIGEALEQTTITQSQRVCLAVFGGNALVKGSVLRTVSASGATARLYPFGFAFSANPGTPTLKPGWFSGLAQGAALGALMRLEDATSDATWHGFAAQTFESFTLTPAEGGVVSTIDGLTWLQEYPTTPPSFVLNGNNEAWLAVNLWAKRTSDPRAVSLAQDVLHSIDVSLPRYQVPFNMGMAQSYDMLRGYGTAYVKAIATGSLTVSSARVVKTDGTTFATVPVVAGALTASGPSVVTNGSLPVAAGTALPSGWRRITTTSTSSVRSLAESGNGYVRTTSSGKGWEAWGQDIPATRLVPGQSYRLTFRARLTVPAGKNGTSGRVTVAAVCSSGLATLFDYGALRGKAWSSFDFMVTMPKTAGCAMRLLFYQEDWHVVGSSLDVDDVSVETPPLISGGVKVPLPLSVIEEPSPLIEVTYTGSGWLGAWFAGHWYRLAYLPAATKGTVRAALPARFQGRNVNLGYDELHVREMYLIYQATGDATAKTYGVAWQPMAPSYMALNFATPPSPGSASALQTPLGAMTPGALPVVPQPGFPAGETVLPPYLGPPPGH